MANFRSTTVTASTSTQVKRGGANVTFINIINRHSAIIYVKFYDEVLATFQDTPQLTLQVAATNILTLEMAGNVFLSTGDGLCLRATTGVNDNDNTAPATLPIIEIQYT